MFLIILLISIAVSLVLNINGESSNTGTNKLSLFIETLFAAMILFILKPSKKNINLLYKDFKSKLNIKEIALIILFLINITYFFDYALTNLQHFTLIITFSQTNFIINYKFNKKYYSYNK